MNDILDFIDELKEIKEVNNDPTTDSKIDKLITKYETQFHNFELAMEEQAKLFWHDTPFYIPKNEV